MLSGDLTWTKKRLWEFPINCWTRWGIIKHSRIEVRSNLTTDESKEARFLALQSWVDQCATSLGIQKAEPIYPISDDASFRRYFRLRHSGGTLICVDAPPDKEDNRGFIKIQALLAAVGVNVPEILSSDETLGFLLLSDLGDDLLLSRLQQADLPTQLAEYKNVLAVVRQVGFASIENLPQYTESKLREEMQLFPDWFLARQLGVTLTQAEQALLASVMDLMVLNASEQPVGFVHRDFHSRNLMLLREGQLGVIDFQDAVAGPITYDLVSLLKDCYWRLPRDLVVDLVEQYRQSYFAQQSSQQFLRWFDLMGFQRHLKCAGIFSRLNLRDGKPGYLGDIPLVLEYLQEVAELYPELESFSAWLRARVVPEF